MLIDKAIDPVVLANELNLIQNADNQEIQNWINQVIHSMPDKAEEYRKGKKGLIGLFVGEVKKISKGKANPQKTTELLQLTLNNKN
jgi:aspartyl-tRNA(Asn)/glutamyl-tRNA(Gln) amidotransferase subunit B